MKVEVEEISSTERKLEVEIPAERVHDEFERAFQDVARHAKIKGFRQGRVPRAVLERYFADDVRSQVTTSLVQEGFSSALEESKLQIVSQPELDIGQLNEKEALRFSARVEIRPDLGSVETDGLVGEKPTVAVGDDNVESVITQLRDRFAELVPVEDRTDLARGDFAGVKLEATLEGEPVDGLQHESATIEIAGGKLPTEVDERLALAKVGETFTVQAPPPEGAPEELKDKTLEYTVTVNSISERVLPEVDDDFAKDHGDCETLDELRNKIRTQLEEDAMRRSDAHLRESVLNDLLKKNTVDLPPSLVARRIDVLLDEFKYELAGRGLQLTNSEYEEEARGKLKERAEREVASDLLLEGLAEQDEVEVSDEELADQIGQILASGGKNSDQLREHYQHGHARDAVRSQMKRARTLERLVSIADVKDVDMSTKN
ncbi:MAG: trigger factor [Candidatus Binatia bacterium]|nr:trigger factor [Candidatus Binatia bacterium]